MTRGVDETLTVPTATGIDIELPIAGPGARSYAFVIDWHIRGLLSFAWAALGIAFAATESPVFLYVFALPATAIYMLYHPVLEIAMNGSTPGKRMAGVRVVTTEGTAPTAGAHLIRNVFRVVDQLPAGYAIGLAATMFTQQSVRIGDLAAGTLLIYENQVSEADWSDLGHQSDRVGLQQAEVIRELLGRWDELDAEHRSAMARTLLARLGQPPELADDQLPAQLRRLLQ